MWRAIADHVAKDAPGARDVLELGAGYCDFINNFPAQNKFAFDLNPEMKAFAAPRVNLQIGDCRDLPGIADESLDLVFASNFLEHFPQPDVELLLKRIHRALRPKGRLALIQPNYHKCAEHYFDDPTHVSIFHDENLPPLVINAGFTMIKIVPGLLPFSMNSRLPKSGLLTRLYLASPVKPMAAQMYLVAQK